MKFLKTIISLVIFSIAILIIFITTTPFRMPSGKYGVGKITYHWVDKSRREPNSKNENTLREVMAYIHYPTDMKIQTPIVPYDLDALQSEKEFVWMKSKIPTFLLSGWNFLKTYAQTNAPISLDTKNYPIIIVPHGGGTMIQHYTWMLEELASHGFIVVGINHPYMAAVTRMPDGRVIKSLVFDKNKDKALLEEWKNKQVDVCVEDIEFVISKLKELNLKEGELLQNKLDLKSIGCAGHSFGGHLALILGMKSSQIKAVVAVVDMDGGQRALPYIIGKKYPTECMIMLADKSRQWRGEQGIKNRKTLEDFYSENKETVLQVILKNVGHGVFTDLAILLNSTFFTRFISNIFDFDLDASSATCCKTMDEIGIYLTNYFYSVFKNEHKQTLGKKINSVKPIMQWAQENLNTEENLKKAEEAVKKMS